MRKNVLLILLMTVVTGFFSSCEKMFGDFLDKQPSNELTESEVFGSWENLKAYHNDTYNFLRSGLAPINNSWLDAATDLATTSYSWGGTTTSFNIGNYYAASGASELRDTWEHYYRGIRKCNTTLQLIDSVPVLPGQNATLRAADVKRIKAEARFLRAYFYWELALRYGPVPIITDRLNPTDATVNNFKRPTEKECFQFILAELTLSYPDLYDDAAIHQTSSDIGRVTMGVNLALQSRIKLYLASDRYKALGLSTWQAAANAAKLFIDTYGSQYRLFSTGNPSTDYQKLFNTDGFGLTDEKGVRAGNNELIFWRNNPIEGWWANESPVGYGGNGGLSPSQNLVDMYDMADGSSPFVSYDSTGAPVYGINGQVQVRTGSTYNEQAPYANRDPRLSQTVLYNGAFWLKRSIETFNGGADKPLGNANATPTGYYNKKYIGEIHPVFQPDEVSRDWVIIRYAEILLNYAEALNEAQGPGPDVFNSIQQIRNRVGITSLVSAKVFNTTNSTLQNEVRKFIRKERTVELAFENHRMWDLKRWNVAKQALARPIYGVSIVKNGNNLTFARKVVENRVFDEKMYLYPIPEEEIWKTGMQNNPGW